MSSTGEDLYWNSDKHLTRARTPTPSPTPPISSRGLAKSTENIIIAIVVLTCCIAAFIILAYITYKTNCLQRAVTKAAESFCSSAFNNTPAATTNPTPRQRPKPVDDGKFEEVKDTDAVKELESQDLALAQAPYYECDPKTGVDNELYEYYMYYYQPQSGHQSEEEGGERRVAVDVHGLHNVDSSSSSNNSQTRLHRPAPSSQRQHTERVMESSGSDNSQSRLHRPVLSSQKRTTGRLVESSGSDTSQSHLNRPAPSTQKRTTGRVADSSGMGYSQLHQPAPSSQRKHTGGVMESSSSDNSQFHLNRAAPLSHRTNRDRFTLHSSSMNLAEEVRNKSKLSKSHPKLDELPIGARQNTNYSKSDPNFDHYKKETLPLVKTLERQGSFEELRLDTKQVSAYYKANPAPSDKMNQAADGHSPNLQADRTSRSWRFEQGNVAKHHTVFPSQSMPSVAFSSPPADYSDSDSSCASWQNRSKSSW